MNARGLIAAAGRSTRMGSDKALLTIDGEPFVVRLVRAFTAGGLSPVLVTVQKDDTTVRALVDGLGAQTLPNAFDDEGFFGSVKTAIDGMRDDAILVVTPVDAPFASADLVRALVSAVDDTHDAAVPVVGNVRGHPIALRALLVRTNDDAGRAGGLAAVLAAPGVRVRALAWDDVRVTESVNTRDELARLVDA